jgi:hypothetical protein
LQACDAHKENKSETVNKTNNTSNNTIETINNNAIQNKLIDLSNNEESTIIRRNMKLNKQTKYCLSFGLNYINPIVYRGNDGKLNGCVNDATNISKFLKTEKQFDIVKTFINEEASIQNFLNA